MLSRIFYFLLILNLISHSSQDDNIINPTSHQRMAQLAVQCGSSSCYDFTSSQCVPVNQNANVELRLSNYPNIVKFIAKKSYIDIPQGLLTNESLGNQTELYLEGLNSSQFNYSFIPRSVDNEGWIFDINFTFAYSLKGNRILTLLLKKYNNYTLFPTNNSIVCQPLYQLEEINLEMRNCFVTSASYTEKMDIQANSAQVSALTAYGLALISTIDVGGLGFRCIQSITLNYQLQVMNIDMPFNGEMIMSKDNNILDFFKTGWFDVSLDDLLRLKDRFYAWNVQPYILNNLGWLIIWLLACIILGCVIIILNNAFSNRNMLKKIEKPNLNPKEKKHNNMINVFLMIRNWMCWKFTFIFILMHFGIISFYTWSNLIFPYLGSGKGIFNFFVALILKVLQCCFYFFAYQIIYYSQQNIINIEILKQNKQGEYEQEQPGYTVFELDSQKVAVQLTPNSVYQIQMQIGDENMNPLRQKFSLLTMKRFKFLYEEFVPELRLYPFFLMLRYELSSFILCVFYNHPLFQIGALQSLTITFCAIVIYFRPLHNSIKYGMAVFTEIITFIYLGLIYYLNFLDTQEQDQVLSVGKFYIMMNLVQRLGCSLICFMETVGALYYMYSSDPPPSKEHAKLGGGKAKDEEHLQRIEKKLDNLVTRFARELKSTNIRLEKIKARYEAVVQQKAETQAQQRHGSTDATEPSPVKGIQNEKKGVAGALRGQQQQQQQAIGNVQDPILEETENLKGSLQKGQVAGAQRIGQMKRLNLD